MSLSLTASQISKPRSARLTTARLCSRRVLMLNWPSCGPDMSPAGMLWNKNIQQMRPWSVKQLKSYIKPEVLKEELLQHMPWTNFLSCVACTKIIVRIYCFKKNNDICSSRLFFIKKTHFKWFTDHCVLFWFTFCEMLADGLRAARWGSGLVRELPPPSENN